MFYYLQGPIAILEPGMAVVDCGGVGYACSVTAYTAAQLKLNQTARLYIHENIREDAFDLFGFASREELRCFQLLLGVNGVGPKAALAILSSGGLHPGRHDRRRKGPDHCPGRWKEAGPADHPGTAGQNRRSCYRVGLLRSRSRSIPGRRQQPHPCHRRFAGAGVFLRRNCRCAEGLQRHRQHRGDGPLRLTCHGEPVMSLQKLTASQIPVCRFCQKLRLVPLPDSLTLFCPLEQGGSTS